MNDFALGEEPGTTRAVPTVLVVGTSMTAGKTTVAKTVIRRLLRRGLKVAGAKLTGVCRYQDILAMQDAGADPVYNFVDAGLPSTILPAAEYRPKLRALLTRFAASGADVLVAEAGASPLERYNGATLLEEMSRQVKCMALCASDPHAALGVMSAFQRPPQLVAGVATSTQAGMELITQLTNVEAVNVLDPACMADLDRILEDSLGA